MEDYLPSVEREIWILYSAKLFKSEGKIKIFLYKQKHREFTLFERTIILNRELQEEINEA